MPRSKASAADEAKLRRKRKLDAARKRRIRASNPEAVRAQKKIDCAACVDLERLLSQTTTDASRPGCLIWTGPIRGAWNQAKPYVFAGQYGRMDAQRAMWLALERPGLYGRRYLKTTCGHDDCVSGEHLYVTNRVQQRVLRATRDP